MKHDIQNFRYDVKSPIRIFFVGKFYILILDIGIINLQLSNTLLEMGKYWKELKQ